MGNTSSAHSRVDVDAVVPHDPDKVSLWTPTEEESKKLKTAKTRKQIKNFAKQKIYFDVSPKMIDMGLYGVEFSYEGMQVLSFAISRAKNVERISLDTKMIIHSSRLFALALEKNNSVKDLILIGNHLNSYHSQEVLFGVSKNKSITYFNLWGSDIGNSTETSKHQALIELFSKNSTLKEVELTHTEMNKWSVRDIAEGLRQNDTLNSLDISMNSIGHGITNSFIKAISNHKTLTCLHLNSITDYENDTQFLLQLGKKISKIIKKCKNLEKVTFDYNRLGPTACTLILESFLKYPNSIREFSLTQSQAGDGCCQLIKQIFETNPYLKEFSFSERAETQSLHFRVPSFFSFFSFLLVTEKNYFGNELSDAGLKKITRGLYKNSSLKQLSLSENNFSERGGKYLGKLIKKNSTLEYLLVSYNGMGFVGLKHVADAIEDNYSIQSLYLWATEGDQKKLVPKIDKCLSRNMKISTNIYIRSFFCYLIIPYLFHYLEFNFPSELVFQVRYWLVLVYHNSGTTKAEYNLYLKEKKK